jgi:hypothetical protein
LSDGRVVNRCVGTGSSGESNRRLIKRKKVLGDYTLSNQSDDEPLTQWGQRRKSNLVMHICEFLVAVVVSVAIHTMSFENGGKKLREQENFDSPEFDYFNYFFRNIILGNEHPNLKFLLQRQDDINSILSSQGS